MNDSPDCRNVSCRKITERIVNQLTNAVTLNSAAFEDLIHPVPLTFEPPYQGGLEPLTPTLPV